MSYNTDHLRTAGKVTVYTTLVGVIAFAIVFIFNLGEPSIKQADAQSQATTTVTVLNTPPIWTASTTELVESSSNNPTNAGDTVSWVGIGTDSNGEDYYLLICDTNATPTPNSGGAPTCSSGVQWAVSTATLSGTQALAATTTYDALSEVNTWFAWICDSNVISPRCNSDYTQGTNATNSSPFEVNHRPSFTAFVDDSPKDPGQTVTFTATASDADVSGVADTVFLTVCATAGYSTTTDTCTGTTLATSTMFFSSNATSTYTIVIPTQDTNYSAFGYIMDNHGFEASGGAQGTDSTLTVNNVAPTVSPALISLVQPSVTDMFLTVEAGETTGFQLSFTTADNNSCDAVGGGSADEITGYNLSIYRSGVGSTTCTTAAGDYDANNCYPSGLATSTWNLTCTASSTTCSGSSDTDMQWDCTFPLWYIADPTDGTATSTQYSTEDWVAQVQGIDDDAATGPLSEASSGVDVRSLLAFALNTLTIPYGSLEPGQQTDPLNATTTISATGNVGLDKDVEGSSMCTTYTGSTPCPNSATSTIPENMQVVATSTVAYAQGTAISSTTPTFVDINVHKSIATSTQEQGSAYWGIKVPATITFAGDYTGQNTITALVSDSSQW
ncbi:MAG TPA: hypothetical protein VFS75_03880 [Candidatus Paceibacterota bacterium]|nr:hypothetical protein [Candidatus Paceibacterota bacterium]